MKSLIAILVAMTLVPYWTEVPLVPFPVIYLVLIVAGAALVPVVRSLKWETSDTFVLAFFFAVVAAGLFGSSFRSIVTGLLQWLVPYVIGRLISAKEDGKSLARVFGAWGVLLAALALLEFTTHWHPFVDFQATQGSGPIWSPIQERGGLSRSEWTFGHSISLGVCIAVCVPFQLLSERKTWIKLVTLAIMFAGCLVTLSRAGLIVFVVAAVLWAWTQRRRLPQTRQMKWALAGAGVVLVGLGAVAAGILFGRADDLASSMDARFSQFALLKNAPWFGPSPLQTEFDGGRVGYLYKGGLYTTVDNAPANLSLLFGLGVGVLLVIALGVACFRLRHHLRDVRVMAFIATVPSVMVVTFITYYGVILWLIFGLAVGVRSAAEVNAAPEPEVVEAT